MSSAAPADKRWLFGPVPDLLFGCGLAYAGVFVALSLAGPELRILFPVALFPLFNLLSSSPHYGATLLRVYERREDRRAYAFFAVWASLALFGLFVWGLNAPLVGSWILTVYLTWSPWHYSGQNYGIAMLFLRRRGVPVGATLKRLLHASFVASFLLTFLALHGQTPAATYAPQGLGVAAFALQPLGLPDGLIAVLMPGVAAVYAGILFALAFLLSREASPRDLAPVGLLVGTQALWFSAPSLARHWGVFSGIEPLSVEFSAYAFVWIATGHALQYLWITAYFAASSGRARSTARFFGKALLAGVSIWTLPALLFAPGVLGRLPYDAGLGILLASVVNLHHFILDGAIWKLRDGRIARVLIRSAEDPVDLPAPLPRHRSWGGAALLASGVLSVIVTITWVVEDEWGFRRAIRKGDLIRAEAAVRRLGWVGHDNAEYQYALGRQRANEGHVLAARAHVERSLALRPSGNAWMLSGRLHEAEQQWQLAADAYARSIELGAPNPTVYLRAGLVALELGDSSAARRYLTRAARIAPNDRRVQRALQRAGAGPRSERSADL